MTALRQRMIEDLRIRNYSPRTIEVYVYHVECLARYFGRSPDQLGREEIRRYQVHLVQEKGLSYSSINQIVCALRFFYFTTLGVDLELGRIPYSKAPKRLPVVLNHDEIARLFEAANSIRHRALFMTLYAAGLRIREALRLEVRDLDAKRMLIHVREGKGNKDRYTLFPPTLVDTLREYWRAYRPEHLLFSGQVPDCPLSKSAISGALARMKRRAEIKKPLTCHTLRHCFATHLLEAGVNLPTVQKLLGHTSLSTTSRYLHVALSARQLSDQPIDLIANALTRDPSK